MNIWTLFDLFAPPCLLCGLPAPQTLCAGCRGDLPPLGPACERCALPLAPPAVAGTCRRCRQQPPALELALAACRYEFPVDRLVQALKFEGKLPVAPVLGRLLADAATAAHARRPLPGALVPVPLHRARQRARGFNQAERIARATGARLGLPVLAGAVVRRRHTDAQSGLDLAVRRQNLQDAFAVTGRLPAHVAIVDDVVTSGSTVLALADTLRAAGVQRIEAWAVARTLE